MKHVYINIQYIFQTVAIWPCCEGTKFRCVFVSASKICYKTFPLCAASSALANCGRTAILFTMDQTFYSHHYEHLLQSVNSHSKEYHP